MKADPLKQPITRRCDPRKVLRVRASSRSTTSVALPLSVGSRNSVRLIPHVPSRFELRVVPPGRPLAVGVALTASHRLRIANRPTNLSRHHLLAHSATGWRTRPLANRCSHSITTRVRRSGVTWKPSASPTRKLRAADFRFAKPLNWETGFGGSNPPLSVPIFAVNRTAALLRVLFVRVTLTRLIILSTRRSLPPSFVARWPMGSFRSMK